MRKSLIVSLAVALVAGAVAVPALAATRSVKIGDDYFVRSSGVPTVTVKKGSKVRWRNTGDSPHNVTVKSGPRTFRSGVIQPGKTFSRKLTKKGTYRIVCTIHPPDQRMTLKVR